MLKCKSKLSQVVVTASGFSYLRIAIIQNVQHASPTYQMDKGLLGEGELIELEREESHTQT